jgi:hypothetical protein
MTNKAQQDLLNQLNEYRQLREFDVVDKIGKGIGRVVGSGAKALGSVAGGVAGLGSAVKQGYQAGKQTVGGGGANVNKGQTKQQPAQQKTPAQGQTPAKTGSTAGGVLGNLAKNVGKVALDTAAGSGYDYRQGVNPNPTKTTGPAAGLQKADAEAQRKAGLEKKLGTTGAQATATNNANNAVDKSIARNQKKIQQKQGGVKQSGISQGIDIAGANKAVANLKAKQAGQTATKVPGQKAPVAQVDANKDGKDDKSGKPMSKTAQTVANKAGLKAGGVKMDPNNPQHKALISAIEKASPGTTKAIDALDPAGKEKLKKAIA